MKPFRIRRALLGALLLCGPFLLPSCSGPESTRSAMTECRCGDPEHDVLGCTGACCNGGRDCDNPACACERHRTGAKDEVRR